MRTSNGKFGLISLPAVVPTPPMERLIVGHGNSIHTLACSSGSRAMLMAMRRALSAVSTFACIASVSVARLYTCAIACPLAYRTT
jgi:hypothetical protein